MHNWIDCICWSKIDISVFQPYQNCYVCSFSQRYLKHLKNKTFNIPWNSSISTHSNVALVFTMLRNRYLLRNGNRRNETCSPTCYILLFGVCLRHILDDTWVDIFGLIFISRNFLFVCSMWNIRLTFSRAAFCLVEAN